MYGPLTLQESAEVLPAATYAEQPSGTSRAILTLPPVPPSVHIHRRVTGYVIDCAVQGMVEQMRYLQHLDPSVVEVFLGDEPFEAVDRRQFPH